MMKKQLTIAYCRCSSDMQSVEHQIASIEAYCKANGITIDKTITDEAISAYKNTLDKRTGLVEVLELANKGIVQNLIIFEQSRLSRRFAESVNIIDTLTKCGVLIHSISDNGVINKAEIDQLLLSFKGWFDMHASKQTGMRVKSKQNQLKAEGLYYAGATPWGFTVIDKRVVPDESLLEEMELFFDTYINYGTKEVMNRFGCCRLTVINRITNEKYKEVVGSDKWNRANSLRNNRRCERDGTAATNKSNALFEGMLYHSCCGSKLYINYDTRTKGRHYYRCVTCRGNESVSAKKSFSGALLDAYIESEVLQVLESLDHQKLQERYLMRCTKHRLVLEMELKNVEHEINDCKTSITKANTKLAQYILDDSDDNLIMAVSNLIATKKQELEQLELKKEDTEARLNNLLNQEQHQEHIIQNILEAKEIYSNASPEQKKAIIQLLVNRIEVTDTKDVSIFLNI